MLMTKKSPFLVSYYSRHGPENPISARLFIQCSELFDGVCPDQELKLDFRDLLKHSWEQTINCYEIQQRIFLADKNCHEKTAELAIGSRNVLPHLENLEGDVIQFLFSAKNLLRDNSKIFNFLYGSELPLEASIFGDPKGDEPKALKWTKQNMPWASKLIDILETR